jgi:hypothetical protein
MGTKAAITAGTGLTTEPASEATLNLSALRVVVCA